MLLLLLACATTPAVPPADAAAPSAVVGMESPVPFTTPEEATVAVGLYREAAKSTVGYERLRYLSDHIGHRINGSPQLDDAISWAHDELKADGFDVRLQPVEVPVWVRGEEQLDLLFPVTRPLEVLGLGRTVATPPEGIEADVVAVDSLQALDALPDDAIAGRIVLFDTPFTTYGETVQVRVKGPDVAAARGAVAVLIRSVTSQSLGAAHTGTLHYAGDVDPIPAGALTVEDASWLHRLARDGVTPRVRLRLSGREAAPAPSANVIADLPGGEHPEQVVVLGCHIDSWDVGQGAQDDGVGCLIVWEAARLIARQPFRPRRTVRVVLYTSEEVGGQGGDAYAAALDDDAVAGHVALIEADTGNGRATGFRTELRTEDAEARARFDARLAALSTMLAPLGGGDLSEGYAGTDIGPVMARGRPGLGLRNDLSTYWPIHHTRADSFDKVDLADMQHNTGLVAAAAWWLADTEEPLVP